VVESSLRRPLGTAGEKAESLLSVPRRSVRLKDTALAMSLNSCMQGVPDAPMPAVWHQAAEYRDSCSLPRPTT
jgi:hypothetical protein